MTNIKNQSNINCVNRVLARLGIAFFQNRFYTRNQDGRQRFGNMLPRLMKKLQRAIERLNAQKTRGPQGKLMEFHLEQS